MALHNKYSIIDANVVLVIILVEFSVLFCFVLNYRAPVVSCSAKNGAL